MQLIVDSKGAVRCVYGEEIRLGAIGRMTVTRASHVEPNAKGGWTADLQPVGGPLLGPFALRSEALAAESGWLETYWLMRPQPT